MSNESRANVRFFVGLFFMIVPPLLKSLFGIDLPDIPLDSLPDIQLGGNALLAQDWSTELLGAAAGAKLALGPKKKPNHVWR